MFRKVAFWCIVLSNTCAGSGACTYPDGGDESWDFIYDKVLDADKQIYALVCPRHIERFVKRYGGAGEYIMAQVTSPEMADSLVALSRRLCRR